MTRNRRVALGVLAALALVACGSVVPGTAARLAGLDPLTADPAGLELAVILPPGLSVTPGTARLEFSAERGRERRSGSFALEERPVPDLAVPPGASARGFALSAADAGRMRALQAEIAGWQREGAARGRIGLGIGGCAVGPGPAPDATGSVLIRLAPGTPFLPLVDAGRLSDLLGPDRLAAIGPCATAQ